MFPEDDLPFTYLVTCDYVTSSWFMHEVDEDPKPTSWNTFENAGKKIGQALRVEYAESRNLRLRDLKREYRCRPGHQEQEKFRD